MVTHLKVITVFFSIVLFSLLFTFSSQAFCNPLMVDIYGNQLISIAVDDVGFKKTRFSRSIMDSAINLSKINEAKNAYKKRGEIILGGRGINSVSQVNSDSAYNDGENWGIKNTIKKTKKQSSTSSKKNIEQKEHRITLTKVAPNQNLKLLQLKPKTANDTLKQISPFQTKASKQIPISLEKKVRTKINSVEMERSKHADKVLAEAQNKRSINIRISVNDTLPIYPSKIEKVKATSNFSPVIASSDIKVSVNDDLLITVAKRIQ